MTSSISYNQKSEKKRKDNLGLQARLRIEREWLAICTRNLKQVFPVVPPRLIISLHSGIQGLLQVRDSATDGWGVGLSRNGRSC
jgi:hypothetical protein